MTESELQRLRGEHHNWLVAGRTERDLHRHLCHHLAHRGLRHESAVMGGAGSQNSAFRGQTPGEECCWLHGDSLKELERATAATGIVCERNPGHHRSETPLLSGPQREGWCCLGSFFLHAPLPAYRGSGRAHPSRQLSRLLCPSCHLGASHLGGLPCPSRCPGRLWEQMPPGCPHAETGLKPQLSPRAWAA